MLFQLSGCGLQLATTIPEHCNMYCSCYVAVAPCSAHTDFSLLLKISAFSVLEIVFVLLTTFTGYNNLVSDLLVLRLAVKMKTERIRPSFCLHNT